MQKGGRFDPGWLHHDREEDLEVLCVWCHALETRKVVPHSWVDIIGVVAQLGERYVRNVEAEGSIPFSSTKYMGLWLSWESAGFASRRSPDRSRSGPPLATRDTLECSELETLSDSRLLALSFITVGRHELQPSCRRGSRRSGCPMAEAVRDQGTGASPWSEGSPHLVDA